MKKNMFWIKTGLMICFVLFIGWMLASESSDSASAISDVENAVTGAADLELYEKEGNQMIKKIFGLNAADYEGIVYYKGHEALDVHEILIVKLKDRSQASAVTEAIQNRIDTQIESFTGYGTDQIRLLNNHEVSVNGNYVFYAVSENAAELLKAYKQSL